MNLTVTQLTQTAQVNELGQTVNVTERVYVATVSPNVTLVNGGGGGDGPQGEPGESAYEIAVDNGFVGTESAWLLSLVGATGAAGASGTPGAAGATGAKGDTGSTGATGAQGIQGIQGVQGDPGATGAAGAAGATGSTGAKGDTGATGAAGADATAIYGDPVAIAHGGTNATTAAAALTNLGAAPVASPTFTGVATAPAVSVTGITGATTDVRLVGGTSGGAPSTGTFVAGDLVLDLNGNGNMWLCLTGGTPGTWSKFENFTDIGLAMSLIYLNASNATTTYLAIAPRVSTTTSGATWAPNCTTTDIFERTAQAVAPTINAPTGSPSSGQKLVFRYKDAGVAKALSWNAAYRGSTGLALPTTTTAGKFAYATFLWNPTSSTWDLIDFRDGF